jgi:hypothetical protein
MGTKLVAIPSILWNGANDLRRKKHVRGWLTAHYGQHYLERRK